MDSEPLIVVGSPGVSSSDETTLPGDTVVVPDAERDRPTRRLRLASPAVYLGIIAIQLVVMWPVATKRGFDGDEGFYAIAAKVVAHGHQPYSSFWFQYPPGLPYVYGVWTRLAGETFRSLRELSIILTLILGVVLYAHVARRLSRGLGVVSVILFITSALAFDWYSTYKSYVLSTLLIFAAYVLVAASDRDQACSRTRWFAAGALLGLSIDVRLFFVAVIPVFVYYAVERKVPALASERLAKIAALIGGLAVGLLPCIYFLALGPRRFVSDVLVSQTNRSALTPYNSLVQKLRTAGQLLGTAQFLILVAACVGLGVFVLATRRRMPLAVAVACALALASLAPTPTYDQYFCTLIPFLAVGAVELWHTLRAFVLRLPDVRSLFVLRAIGVMAVLAFVISGAGAYDAIMNSGDTLLDIPHALVISKAIDTHTRVGEVVIDFSPVDLYQSHAVLLSGLESDFGTVVAGNLNLSDGAAARDKVLTINQLAQVVESRKIRTVVVAPYDRLLFPRPWETILRRLGYRPVETVGGRTIYQLPQG